MMFVVTVGQSVATKRVYAAWVQAHALAGINASAFTQTPSLPSLVDARARFLLLVPERERVCVCVCVCERERESSGEGESESMCACRGECERA